MKYTAVGFQLTSARILSFDINRNSKSLLTLSEKQGARTENTNLPYGHHLSLYRIEIIWTTYLKRRHYVLNA